MTFVNDATNCYPSYTGTIRVSATEYLATPLEWRIDEAAKSDTPWQFSFVLRGGWMQAREQLNTLRDFDRVDLLFVLLAARQFCLWMPVATRVRSSLTRKLWGVQRTGRLPASSSCDARARCYRAVHFDAYTFKRQLLSSNRRLSSAEKIRSQSSWPFFVACV